MFAHHAYDVWVKNVSEPVVEAWDTKFGETHVQACGNWPSRPNSSYAHHMALAGSLHYDRDGDSESGLRFGWDVENMLLKKSLDPHYGSRFFALAKLQGLRTSTSADCFDGPHSERVLRHCATNANHALGTTQSAERCIDFPTLQSAQMACLRWESCGGIVLHEEQRRYSLHSTTQLIVMQPKQIPNCRTVAKTSAWVRKTTSKMAACIASPAIVTPTERKVVADHVSQLCGLYTC